MIIKKSVWIGLVSVVQRAGAQTALNAAAKGAFVNALAYVADAAEYRVAVDRALSDLGLTAYEYEDVEAFSERLSKWEVDDALQELAAEVDATQAVRFGTFHTYSGVE